MKLLSTFLIVSTLLFPPNDISMQGIKINDIKKSLVNLNLTVVAKDDNVIKYKTRNGNDLSITFNNDKVVFMENDWNNEANSNQSLYSDFRFGKTTLNDIRSKFATNGFVYVNQMTHKTATDLYMFNCFEFDSNNNEVLVTVTKLSFSEYPKNEAVGNYLKLDALIIADKSYLDNIWGKEKSFDSDYKKITSQTSFTNDLELNAKETTYVLKFLHVNSKGWFTFKDDISNPNASICTNNGKETKMYKTYFKLSKDGIYSVVNSKIERSIKFIKPIGSIKNKVDNIGKYEYQEYEGTRYIGNDENPLNGKFQFGKLYMNNTQYYYLQFEDNQETLFILN